MRHWVSQEDEFVLKQAKKKAKIRVKEGRAKPIDWLAVTLSIIDPTRDLLEEDNAGSELDVVSPDGVFEGLDEPQLRNLEKDVDVYITLESNRSNSDYWKVCWLSHMVISFTNSRQTMKIICRDRLSRLASAGPEARAVGSVSADVDRLLGPKTYQELDALETQISRKLNSNEPIDVDYWEQLLRSLTVWKARAKLKKVYQSVVESRLSVLKQQQEAEAESAQEKLALLFSSQKSREEEHGEGGTSSPGRISLPAIIPPVAYSRELDPEPLLKLRPEDKSLDTVDEKEFLNKIVCSLFDCTARHALLTPLNRRLNGAEC